LSLSAREDSLALPATTTLSR